MKRIVVKLVVISLLVPMLALFASCGKKSANPEENSREPIIKTLDEVKLTFLFLDTLNSRGKPDVRMVLDEIEKQTRDKLNVKLDFQWLPAEEYAGKIKAMAASDEPVDAFYCGINKYLFNIAGMAKNGELKDITQLFPRYAPGLYRKYDEGELASAMIDRKLVAVPSLYPLTYSSYAVVREDLVKKYKIPEIKTFDDYETYLRIIKENEKEAIPGKICSTTMELFAGANNYAILDSSPENYLVYRWDDPQMKITPWEQTQAFENAAKRIVSWYGKGYLHPAEQSSSMEEILGSSVELMASGKIASMLIDAEARVPETVDYLVYLLQGVARSSTEPDAEINAYRLYPEKKAQRMNPIGDAWAGGSIAFNAKSKNTERSLMFLDWIQQQQDNYDLVMYGIKDRHYVLKNGQYSYPEGIDFNNSPYFPWSGRLAFRNIRYERVPYPYPEGTKQKHMDFIRTGAQFPSHEGFYPDYATFLQEVDTRQKAVMTGIELKLLDGTYNPENTGSIIEELKNAGTDKIVGEIQKQLDGWKNAK